VTLHFTPVRSGNNVFLGGIVEIDGDDLAFLDPQVEWVEITERGLKGLPNSLRLEIKGCDFWIGGMKGFEQILWDGLFPTIKFEIAAGDLRFLDQKDPQAELKSHITQNGLFLDIFPAQEAT